NNAPGYFAASGRPAISIPDGDLQAACAAAQKYHASYLLLEIDQIRGGAELFDAPGDRLCLQYLGAPEGIRVYRTVAP
ncbi:MAG: hypothetical protein IT316_13205, partial [Anaerolineales bacterium]|nr:hypothetical protein [Anaerolineales bacterium]